MKVKRVRALHIDKSKTGRGGKIRHGHEGLDSGNREALDVELSFGSAPEAGAVVVTRLGTPLGPTLAAATVTGICLLEFTDRRRLERELAQLEKCFGARPNVGTSPHFAMLKTQLEEYFAGTRTAFSVPLDAPGTPFQQQVWSALTKIPYGHTRSYQDQARVIGRPQAVRAVARANGDNRVSILIPCHRVIGKDGSLTGYGGGLWRKRELLALEARTAGTADQRELF